MKLPSSSGNSASQATRQARPHIDHRWVSGVNAARMLIRPAGKGGASGFPEVLAAPGSKGPPSRPANRRALTPEEVFVPRGKPLRHSLQRQLMTVFLALLRIA